MVDCVPINIKCLSGVDIMLIREAVGAPDIAVHLVDTPADVSHIKAPPFNTVAIRSSPKLSNDHCLASKVTLDVVEGDPQPPAPQVSVPHPKAGVEKDGPILI